MISLLWIFAHTAFGAEVHPADAVLDDSVAIEVTDEGLSALGGLAAVLLPPDPIPLDELGDTGGFSCLNYEFSLTGAEALVEVQDAQLIAGDRELRVEVDLLASINSASDPFDLYIELFCAGQNCPGYVEPFQVTASIPVVLQVIEDAEGNDVFDAVVGEPEIDNQLSGDDIQLDCAIGTLETVLDFFGLSLYDLIIGIAEPQILSALTDAMGDLEQTLDEALAQARVEQDIEVSGTTIHLALTPQDAVITENEGMELVFRGHGQANAQAACIAAYDPNGSLSTPSARPTLADLDPSTQVAALVADDFLNQVLYAVWQGGVLCYEVTDDADLGVPINTSLLGLLGGEEFNTLFPETEPLVIVTDPREAPTSVFTGDHDIEIAARNLDVNFYAGLDYRTARALGVTITADVGVDLLFDGTTGMLDVALDLGEGAIGIEATGNELAPWTNADVEATFAGLVDTLIDSLLGDMLDGLSFAVPAMDGLGLTELTVGPGGVDGDWLEASTAIGEVTYGGEGGCSDEGGCGGSEGCEGEEGCDQGCSTGRMALWPWWFVALPLGLLLRRKSFVP